MHAVEFALHRRQQSEIHIAVKFKSTLFLTMYGAAKRYAPPMAVGREHTG